MPDQTTASASSPAEQIPATADSTVKTRKKPGRKPNPASPALRKAQNRTAQRAFRERKERHLKELEETIKELRSERETYRIEVDKEKTALLTMLEHMRGDHAHLMALVMQLQGCLRDHGIPLPIVPRNLDEAIVVSEDNEEDVVVRSMASPTDGLTMMSIDTPTIRPLAPSRSFESILRSSLASTPVVPSNATEAPPYMFIDPIDAPYCGDGLFDDDFIHEENTVCGDSLPYTVPPSAEPIGTLIQPTKGTNFPVQIRFHPTPMDKQQQLALEEGGEMQNGAGQFMHVRIMLH